MRAAEGFRLLQCKKEAKPKLFFVEIFVRFKLDLHIQSNFHSLQDLFAELY